MKLADLLRIVGAEPLFESSLLLAGDVDPGDVRRQLSRWVQGGQLLQLRRGVYALAAPYRRVEPHPFVIANRLVRGSYVSGESALAYRDLIPEAAPAVTSVCPGRPGTFATPLGRFHYQRIKPALLTGYALVEVGGGQRAFVAGPEKALLDLAHLRAGADSPEFLGGLRLQNLDQLDLGRLATLARDARSPKLERVARQAAELARGEREEYERL